MAERKMWDWSQARNQTCGHPPAFPELTVPPGLDPAQQGAGTASLSVDRTTRLRDRGQSALRSQHTHTG